MKRTKKQDIRIWAVSAAVGVLSAALVFTLGGEEKPPETQEMGASGRVISLHELVEERAEENPVIVPAAERVELVEAGEDYENEKIEAALIAQGYLREDIPLPLDEQYLLRAATDEFCVDYFLMVALIERETDFRNIYGDGGAAYGYCQIWPYWWADLMAEIGVDDLNDPYDNFRAGCAILSLLIERHGSVEYALTAYNRGTPGESEYSEEIMERAEFWRR